MGLLDELRDAQQSAKTHETICQSLLEENKKYRLTLQFIADDSETQTSGHIGMNRLAGYAKNTLEGSDWLDEFEKDEQIAKLESQLAERTEAYRRVVESKTELLQHIKEKFGLEI